MLIPSNTGIVVVSGNCEPKALVANIIGLFMSFDNVILNGLSSLCSINSPYSYLSTERLTIAEP